MPTAQKIDWFGIDFDGLFVNAADLKARAVKDLFGVTLTPQQTSKEAVEKHKLITLAQYEEAKTVAYDTEKYLDTMQEIPGALATTRKLLELPNTRLLIVTSRGRKGTAVARRWLVRKDLDIDIIGTSGAPKDVVVKGFTAYADDAVKKLKPCIGKVKRLFHFSQPYNLHHSTKGIATRIFGWDELYTRLVELKR